jgi:osmoprotectant transport system permease protein
VKWVGLICFFLQTNALASGSDVAIGSKKFTESVILGEVAALATARAGATPKLRRELGGTQVLFHALERGDLDLYPEYTGTIADDILDGKTHDEAEIRKLLAARHIVMTRSLGYANTYAIGLSEATCAKYNLHSLADLAAHPELRFGFSDEFMSRPDGWPRLRDRYQLPQKDVRGLDHDLAYRALAAGSLDAIDLYTTDAEIRYYHLCVLKDDRGVFPDYQAVFLYRDDLAPAIVERIRALEGQISERAMIDMNARAKLDRIPEATVAAQFLDPALLPGPAETFWSQLARHTRDHLLLVLISLLAAIAVAVPLGIAAARRPRLGQIVLAIVGVVQTVPSLALLVFMIPLLGIGAPPAIVALFLYSLLPIVRNTVSGLRDIAPPIRESAAALGLPSRVRLFRIELPLASRTILAGIKTSAVINVGTATLGAIVGAGGYGQPILTGIRRDDVAQILSGAIPAAVLALLVQLSFELAERVLVPRGLRIKSSSGE